MVSTPMKHSHFIPALFSSGAWVPDQLPALQVKASMLARPDAQTPHALPLVVYLFAPVLEGAPGDPDLWRKAARIKPEVAVGL